MNIVIRTDASVEIGTGHVMRCLTLAKQLKCKGANIIFLCRKLEGNSIGYLQNQGFEVLTLPDNKNSFMNLSSIKDDWLHDAQETIILLKDRNIDMLIVDHYSLDRRWEEKMRSITSRILVIDDLANRKHDCDFLLDQNYYPNMDTRYIGLVPEHCVLMLGPEYVLLREEFIEAAKKPRKRSGEVERVLIFFGGTDPTGETIKALNAIKKTKINFSNIDVVVGFSNPYKIQIKSLCKIIPNTHYHCQINNMAMLMMKADLAIGAGGSTTWERCLLGLPTLVIVVASNQKEIINSASEINLCFNLGDSSVVTEFDIHTALKNIINDTKSLENMSDSCSTFLDKKKVINYPIATLIKGAI